MKALSQTEIGTKVQVINSFLVGAQLQEIFTWSHGIILEFYRRKSSWLILDLSMPCPMILLMNHRPPLQKSSSKPVCAFLNAHGKNLLLKIIQPLENYGRVIDIFLENSQKKTQIQFVLIPRAVNLIVSSEGKSISWNKPRELVLSEIYVDLHPRSIEEIDTEWLKQWAQAPKKKSGGLTQSLPASEQSLQKIIDKKTNAIVDMENILQANSSHKYYAEGEAYKLQGNFKKMQESFTRAKLMKRKQEGTEGRIQILKKEVTDLEIRRAALANNNADSAAAVMPEMVVAQQVTPIVSKELKSRRLDLKSGAIAYMGKTAKDNLYLLRKAQPWDLWLHLKDYPGAHGIIRRLKNKNISDEEIKSAAFWLLNESVRESETRSIKDFIVIIVECRMVRPLKGDRLGRVTYAPKDAQEVRIWLNKTSKSSPGDGH